MKLLRALIESISIPAWNRSDQDAALLAVNSISEQSRLGEVALQASAGPVRLAACDKIDDEDVLIKVAFCSQDFNVASQALHRLFCLPKTFPNAYWRQTDLVYKLVQVPFNPDNAATIAIRFEDNYPGLCEAVIKTLKRFSIGKNVLTMYNPIEGVDTDEAKITLIKFLILHESSMMRLYRPLSNEGASTWKRNLLKNKTTAKKEGL